jgi:cobalt/nickel transport system permease protein
MPGTHLLIGIGEGNHHGASTAWSRVRPDLVYGARICSHPVAARSSILAGGRDGREANHHLGGRGRRVFVALGLAFFVSRFASSSPDGLNKVAIDQGSTTPDFTTPRPTARSRATA